MERTRASKSKAKVEKGWNEAEMTDAERRTFLERIGFVVYPNFLTSRENEDLKAYMRSAMTADRSDGSTIATRAKRRRSNTGKAVDVSSHKYGHEFYIQTKHFIDTVAHDKDGCYSRKPADHTKHMICVSDPVLEDDRNKVVEDVSRKIGRLPIIDSEKLYLIQCIHYNGEMKRGKHIDNKVNGGHLIVGCTIGDSERFMEVSGTYGDDNQHIYYRFSLPPRTLYVMKGQSRYNFYHDPVNDPTAADPPYAMVFRFGKFDIDRGLADCEQQ